MHGFGGMGRLPLWMLGLHAYLMQIEKHVDFHRASTPYIYILKLSRGKREKTIRREVAQNIMLMQVVVVILLNHFSFILVLVFFLTDKKDENTTTIHKFFIITTITIIYKLFE